MQMPETGSNEMPHILLLTDGITPYVLGGMQKHSYYLTRYLVQSGCRVTLLHCVEADFELPTESSVKNTIFGEEIQEKFEVLTLHFPKAGRLPGHYIRNSYRYSCDVYDAIKDRLSEFDFIYCKGFAGWKLLEEKSQRKLGVPVAIKMHGLNMFQKPANARCFIEHVILFRRPVKFMMRHSDYVFSYGGKITDITKALGIVAEKIIEVPTGIDDYWLESDSVEDQSDARPLRFLYVGRYERLKGIEELGDAIERIDENESFEFHFVGPIPEDKQINDSRAIYHGLVSDIDRLRTIYRESDILVCASYSEGMPNVIMEAMSQGMSIISTDVGAVSVLVNQDNGWLLDEPSVGNLETAICSALKTSEEQLALKKKRAREHIESNFKWRDIVHQLLSKIERCIS